MTFHYEVNPYVTIVDRLDEAMSNMGNHICLSGANTLTELDYHNVCVH
jgi:hypothetical protein